MSEPKSAIKSHRDLIVWQESMNLAVGVYKLAKVFPREELYGLTSQVRRASASVPANIAEGYGRESTGSYIQALRIAQGSLKELETHLVLSVRVEVAAEDSVAPLLDNAEVVGKMLRSLIRSLEQRQ
jgi:four helix bundle protein